MKHHKRGVGARGRWIWFIGVALLCACRGSGNPSPNRPDANPPANGSAESYRYIAKAATEGWCYDIAFSPDGTVVGVASVAGVEIRDGNDLKLTKILTGPDTCQSLSFSPDGKHVAGGGWTGRIRIWDWKTGQEVYSYAPHGESNQGSCTVNELRYSPDGKLIASAAGWAGRGVVLWDLSQRKEVARFEPGANNYKCAFSPDAKLLAVSAERSRIIKIFDLTDGPKEIRVLAVESIQAYAIAFSPDGGYLYAPNGNKLEHWAIADWNYKIVDKSKQFDPQRNLTYFGVRGVSISADGSLLATSGSGVSIYDVHRDRLLVRLQGHGSTTRESAIAFSPDGRRIAYITSGGMCFLPELKR